MCGHVCGSNKAFQSWRRVWSGCQSVSRVPLPAGGIVLALGWEVGSGLLKDQSTIDFWWSICNIVLMETHWENRTLCDEHVGCSWCGWNSLRLPPGVPIWEHEFSPHNSMNAPCGQTAHLYLSRCVPASPAGNISAPFWAPQKQGFL